MKEILVVCGPTASGKTKFAHEFAQNNNGEIVNADSMQLYKQLPIITASPDLTLKAELPYHLYNFLDVDCNYSVAKYAEIAAQKIKEVASYSKLPVLVGGSGMYINALINGLSYVPDIKIEVRNKVRDLQKSLSPEEFFDLLKQADPETAKVLNIMDSQRVARAYEVYVQTGKSILDYQKNMTHFLPDFTFKVIFVLPERQFLYSMCNYRLEKMFKNEGIEEVERLITENKNINASVMKALGVQEIIDYLQGNISKELALERAQTRTRQYAKRQITWFNNQIKEKIIVIPNQK